MRTYWKTSALENIKSLNRDLSCDVLIIGAGIVGLSAALELTQLGYRPVVLSKNAFEENTTTVSAGILSQETTVDLHNLVEKFGIEKTKLFLSEQARCLRKAYATFGPGNDWFQKGSSMFFAANRQDDYLIDFEFSIREKLNLQSKLVSQLDVQSLWLGFSTALKISDEFSVDPVQLLQSMAKELIAAGGKLRQYAPVNGLSKFEDGRYVTCAGEHKITSKHVVWATGAQSFASKLRLEINRFERASTCVVVTRPSREIAQMVEDTGVINFWDSFEHYTYGRYFANGRMLVGGQDRSGFEDEGALAENDGSVQTLLEWARQHHRVKIPPFECAWRANLIIPFDGMPALSVFPQGSCLTVSAVTDGLPSGLWLGSAVAKRISEADECFSG